MRWVFVPLALVCACDHRVRDSDVTTAARQTVRSVGGVCIDSVGEEAGLRCSPNNVRRVGRTLYLKLKSGREITFVDTPAGESESGTMYVGRIGRLPLHMLSDWGGERPPIHSLVSGADGTGVSIGEGMPLFSPDSTHFAVDSPNWGNCTEDSGASLSIWRMTDGLPVLSWGGDTGDCDQHRGWGATEVRWHTSDTLSFTQNDLTGPDSLPRPTHAARLIRNDTTWHLVLGAPIGAKNP